MKKATIATCIGLAVLAACGQPAPAEAPSSAAEPVMPAPAPETSRSPDAAGEAVATTPPAPDFTASSPDDDGTPPVVANEPPAPVGPPAASGEPAPPAPATVASAAPPPAPAPTPAAPRAPATASAKRPAPAAPAPSSAIVRGAAVSGEGFKAWLETRAAHRVGQPATVTAVITAEPPFKCNDQYPYRLKLEPGAGGVQVPSAPITSAQIGKERTTLTFSVSPTAKGQTSVSGTLSFSVCTPERCLVEKQKVSVSFAAE